MASFFALCVHMHVSDFYTFVCSQNLQQHTVPPHVCLSPPVCCYQWTWFTTHTPHPQLLDGIIKVRLHRLWPLKKTHGCFSPTKRAINSVSQGVTHSSGRLCMAEIAHTAHLPFSLRFSNKIYVDSWPRYISDKMCWHAPIQHYSLDGTGLIANSVLWWNFFFCLYWPPVTTNLTTSWSLNMAICIGFHTVEVRCNSKHGLALHLFLQSTNTSGSFIFLIYVSRYSKGYSHG